MNPTVTLLLPSAIPNKVQCQDSAGLTSNLLMNIQEPQTVWMELNLHS